MSAVGSSSEYDYSLCRHITVFKISSDIEIALRVRKYGMGMWRIAHAATVRNTPARKICIQSNAQNSRGKVEVFTTHSCTPKRIR
jgi:hypothetical protein